MPKTWYKVVIIVVSVILAILLLGFCVLVFNEYFPEETEELTIDGAGTKTLKIGEDISLITYNLGYLSLDNTQDYFMEGGSSVRPASATNVTKNLAALKSFLENQNADIYLFQEVDINAKRSYYTNEYEGLKEDFEGTATFAYEYNSMYIPYPLFNCVGRVESGSVTLNKYNVESSTRISLPNSFSWPKRAVMYKNCALSQRIKIEGTDKELVVFNIHLDDYGKEEKRQEQLNKLIELMQEEYEKGNYVIAGGDFSQNFPGFDEEVFPNVVDTDYVITQMDESCLSEGWSFVADLSKPTARLLNEEYSGNYDNTQLYITDGYIVSPNVVVNSVETIENNFSYSDHQPVKLSIKIE